MWKALHGMDDTMTRSILITGAGGYIGTEVLRGLAEMREQFAAIVAVDVRETPAERRIEGIVYEQADVRDPALADMMTRHSVNTVVHLASIVSPGRDEALEYSVDVEGTENVLNACVASGVDHLIVTSSGAAYGYHADNPAWLSEEDPLRGNDAFSYSRHKRLVEEMLAFFRQQHPALRQLVLRPGTVLGETTDNDITRLFNKPSVLGVTGTDTPFVFIWDQDVVAVILDGIVGERAGIYNLAGDGTVTLREIAEILGKPFKPKPPWLLKLAIGIANRLGLTQKRPEQVMFLQYRPVLSNLRLKDEFGYTPCKTSREVFDFYLEHHPEARGRGAP